MKITAIRAYPLFASFERMYGVGEVPASVLAPASHFRRIPRTGQHATVVEVLVDDGQSGWGEAFGLPHAMAAASLVEAVIAPALVGLTVDEPRAMLADLMAYFVALGHTRGAAMEALSGVDIALWDLRAKAAGQPLAEYLGGRLGPVATYASPVPFLDTPAQSAHSARDFLAQGFTGLKLKIGRGVETDLQHIRAVRDAIGPGTALMLDANCAYGVDEAIRLAQALGELAPFWLEEPIRPDAPLELAEVRRHSPVPIACGENEFTLASFEGLVRAGAVDYLMPNITRAGGVSGVMAIHALCERHGVRLAPHGVGGGIGVATAVHVACAASSFAVYEANQLPNALRSELPADPIALSGGRFHPGTRPGHGCALRPEVLASYDLRAGGSAPAAGRV